MKVPLLVAALLLPQASLAEGYVMGAGRWTCAEVVTAGQGGNPSQQGQLAGWVLGFWSAATFARETAFIDTVERAGAQAVFEATLAECSKAPPDTPLHVVARTMIENTR